jgi:hypothetical protein
MDEKDDFKLCDDVFMGIVSRYPNDAKATDYDEKERIVILVWHVYGLIGNGGFEYLFEADYPGDPFYELSVQAFETIQCQPASTAFRDALGLFPGGKPPRDIYSRRAAYETVPEEKRKVNSRFWNASKEIEQNLAAYIRSNRAAFEHARQSK